MFIHVNGERQEVPENISLSNLIEQLELPAQRIAVELNREVIRSTNWSSTLLGENDRIEIVHFVGGGCGFASVEKSV